MAYQLQAKLVTYMTVRLYKIHIYHLLIKFTVDFGNETNLLLIAPKLPLSVFLWIFENCCTVKKAEELLKCMFATHSSKISFFLIFTLC